MKRCNWTGLTNSETYREYHDNEWGVESHDDRYLFEMFVLESFHCGLSWLIILNKRDAFKKAFDDFDPYLVREYTEEKMTKLVNNKDIVRHMGKIKAAVNNADCFIKVQEEFGSFDNYIWSFTNQEVVYNRDDVFVTKNLLSDLVSKDLKKRGFKFMGSVTAMSYLEAIGILNNHSTKCFKFTKSND